MVINIILSIILLFVFIYALITYNPQWRFFFFLSAWSYLLTIYYIISVTIIDLISLISNKFFTFYNNFIRNYFIRICIPFGITSAFVYWELVLLGKNFQHIGHDSYDVAESIFLNGIVQFFLLFDMFASHHIYKHHRINDILILTIILASYYLLICLGKYLDIFEPYDFMERSDVRQIIGVGIIVYVLLLNGYIVFDLLALCLFEKENKKKKISIINEDKKEMTSREFLNNNSTNENENMTNEPININDFNSHIKQINLSHNDTINYNNNANNGYKYNINTIYKNRNITENNNLDIKIKN